MEDDDENEDDENPNWKKKCLAGFVARYNIAYKRQPNSIMLKDGKSFITKRKRPCVIRYFLKYDNPEEYLRALCILFLPFRNEMAEIHTQDLERLYEKKKKIIEKNRQKFERHKNLVEFIAQTEKDKQDDVDEVEEEDSPYIDEETTAEDEIEDFEKKLKAEAQKTLENFNAGSDFMEDDEYLEMISKLNEQQRDIFDDFVERINLDEEGNNFYLYIGGNAGTGKSFLLKVMINAAKKRAKRSGAELDKPISLTMAPTGVAAYLVNEVHLEYSLQKTKHI